MAKAVLFAFFNWLWQGRSLHKFMNSLKVSHGKCVIMLKWWQTMVGVHISYSWKMLIQGQQNIQNGQIQYILQYIWKHIYININFN